MSAPRPQQVAGFVLAVTIAVLFTLAVVHWMACSQAGSSVDGAALCMAAAIPRRRAPVLAALCPRWLGRLYDRAAQALRCACLRADLRLESELLENMHDMRDRLPQQIARQKVRVDVLRVRLIAAQNAARGDAA